MKTLRIQIHSSVLLLILLSLAAIIFLYAIGSQPIEEVRPISANPHSEWVESFPVFMETPMNLSMEDLIGKYPGFPYAESYEVDSLILLYDNYIWVYSEENGRFYVPNLENNVHLVNY